MNLTIFVRIREGILYKFILEKIEDFNVSVNNFKNKILYKEVDCY